MKKSLTALCAAIGFAVLPSIASAQLWNFDTGAQGWQILDTNGVGDYNTSYGTYMVDWHASGGNPGAYISGLDPSGNNFMFEAPSGQLGNYSQFLGGKLNYSLATDETVDYVDNSVIVLKGGANLQLVAAINPLPNANWTSYSIDLKAVNFKYNITTGATVSEQDFESVLANLTGFLVNAEFHNGVSETTSLDGVSFEAAQNTGAVPEASTFGLAGVLALVAAIGVRRAMRRR